MGVEYGRGLMEAECGLCDCVVLGRPALSLYTGKTGSLVSVFVSYQYVLREQGLSSGLQNVDSARSCPSFSLNPLSISCLSFASLLESVSLSLCLCPSHRHTHTHTQPTSLAYR